MSTNAMRALVTIVLFQGSLAVAGDGDGFTPLVVGGDIHQFELVDIGEKTMTIDDGEIRLSGAPNGYFATKKPYKNYVLRFEWKYDRPDGYRPGSPYRGNSGVLVHIAAPHKVWPKCVEVQLAYAEAGHIFAINGAKFQGKTDRAALKRSIKPVGEWNTEEIICKGGEMTCRINGEEIARGTGATPDEGTIGWQSEGGVIRFRKMQIKTLD